MLRAEIVHVRSLEPIVKQHDLYVRKCVSHDKAESHFLEVFFPPSASDAFKTVRGCPKASRS